MSFAMVLRILGLITIVFSATMLPPVVVSLLFQDGHWVPFVEAFAIVFVASHVLAAVYNHVARARGA